MTAKKQIRQAEVAAVSTGNEAPDRACSDASARIVAAEANDRDPLHRLIRFATEIGSERGWRLLDRYDLGQHVKNVYDNATIDGTRRYGAHAINAIATAVELKPDIVRKAMRFAAAFPRGKVEELSERRLRSGAPFSWSHTRRLLEVRNGSERDELIELTVANSWTSEHLAEEIQRRKGGKQNKGGRRRSPEQGKKLLSKLLSDPEMAAKAREMMD